MVLHVEKPFNTAESAIPHFAFYAVAICHLHLRLPYDFEVYSAAQQKWLGK